MQSLLSRLMVVLLKEAYSERDSASKPACREFSTGWNCRRCLSLPDCSRLITFNDTDSIMSSGCVITVSEHYWG